METTEKSLPQTHFARNVVVKALLLFFIFNLAFAWLDPMPAFERISAYNRLFPGRTRLPYGDNPEKAYNLSLFELGAMFASHEISAGSKPQDEFRVILIGDSSTWGWLLPANQTLTAFLNSAGYTTSAGRKVRFYNLGYPVMSLTKDLLLLTTSLRYQPDLIVWPITLESFPYDKQLYPPLLQHNPQAVRALIQEYHLKLDPHDPNLIEPTFWDHTIVGERRPLADLVRLQLYGVMWAATGIDQDIPATYTPRQEDLSSDMVFHNLKPPHLQASDLALDILKAGITAAGHTPVLLVNEPMFISKGKNSNIRYNFYYPRWAYDDYRKILQEQSLINGWQYIDLWDSIPETEFTNSAVHLSPQGEAQFAQRLGKTILDIIGKP